ncbi:molybdopterin-dependent oxidoreductase [Phenylobacterium sp. LjRoot225]|uniref:xanthine dehydrogenase family protein molybdopterin-binding subunit n=1 Tax=Phenylobacterium sp. LjRoot225 TaxID=3342285 RepID=UPI003ECCC677
MNAIKPASLDRRKFLVSAAVVAGGLSLALTPARGRAAGAGAGETAAEISPWIVIAPDDAVIIRSPTTEIGNGAMTQVAMNVAEELQCDWSKVRVEFASPRRDYLEKGVYQVGMLPFFSGHGTDPDRMKHALQLGASARERLKGAAAARWNAPVSEIEAQGGVLTHQPTGRKLRYGEVAAEAASVQLADEPALKAQSDWTFLGKASPPKLNAPQIADGAAVFGIDVQRPGMVYAALLQSPVMGGKLKSHDPSAVLKMPGVRAVVVVDRSKTKGTPVKPKSPFGLATTETQSAVAVIADHFWQAKTALEALPVEWDDGPGAAWKTSNQIYDAGRALLDQGGKVVRKVGAPDSVTSETTIEATYLTPYCDNAAMEPLNSTVQVGPDRVEIWHPSQDQQQAFWVAVDETGMAPENVYLHQTLVGGGFGRRTMAEELRMAVAVAKEYPGPPVKVIWTREETTRQGRYRTPVISRFKARLGKDGLPEALLAHVCYGGEPSLPFGIFDTPYVGGGGIPNAEFAQSRLKTHVLTGAYRAPCYNSHVFMLESFIDECAHAAKADPVEYRLGLLKGWDPAWSACLKVAAQKAGWGRRLPKGQGRGVAIANWPMASQRKGGATMCAVAHVAVSRDGVLQVKQIDYAFDCGRVANRDAALAQIEGGILFGLNTALNEEITIRDGAVVEGNYDEYPMLRMADVPPKINIHFDALSGHDRFAMIGEAPVGPVQAAVGNAIFQATGKRLRTTPFRKQNLSWS